MPSANIYLLSKALLQAEWARDRDGAALPSLSGQDAGMPTHRAGNVHPLSAAQRISPPATSSEPSTAPVADAAGRAPVMPGELALAHEGLVR